MPKSHADCASYAGNLTNHYCFKHSRMFCVDCVKKYHHSCEALPIPDVCKTLDSEDVKRFKSFADDIKQNRLLCKRI